MVVAVARHLVPTLCVLARELGLALARSTHDEERRRSLELVEEIEVGSGHRVGAIVERECYATPRGRPALNEP